ncbi:MAG: alpha/beta hydrolase [Rubrivivax sp.]
MTHLFAGEERRVAYELLGDAGPLACIVIHAGPGFTRESLKPGMEVLAKRMPVMLIDLPGCGESSRHGAAGYSLEAYAADVEAVRQEMGEGDAPVVLLGHGSGALVAAEYAARFPSKAAALILVNPLRILNAAGPDPEAQQRQVDRVDPTLHDRFVKDVLPLVQPALEGEFAWEDLDRNPWWMEMIRTQWHGPVDPRWEAGMKRARLGMESYFAQKGAAMFNPESPWAKVDLADMLKGLKPAVGVIASTSDANYVAPVKVHVAPLVERFAALPVQLIGDAGHFLPCERPEAFADAFMAMLGRLRAREPREHPPLSESHPTRP